jgi:tRNA nucleotidyltransferase/poly(A) polymerase
MSRSAILRPLPSISGSLPAALQAAVGYAANADVPVRIVGGAAGDLLLGRPVKDLDVLAPTDALAWSARMARQGGHGK